MGSSKKTNVAQISHVNQVPTNSGKFPFSVCFQNFSCIFLKPSCLLGYWLVTRHRMPVRYAVKGGLAGGLALRAPSSVASTSRAHPSCVSRLNTGFLSTSVNNQRQRVSIRKGTCSKTVWGYSVGVTSSCSDLHMIANSNRTLQRTFHSSRSVFASTKDPYEALGVPRDASAAEIKKKYYEV